MEMIGKKFGKLTVESFAGIRKNHWYWNCLCECGKRVTIEGHSMRKGHTTSCGCVKRNELIGKTFGRLTVISLHKVDKHRQTVWECRCDCGKIKFIGNSALVNEKTRSCGCLNKDAIVGRQEKSRIELIGKRYGRLVVMEYSHTKKRRTYWKCRCDCGNEKVVNGGSLRSGLTHSCGCLQKEGIARAAREWDKTHPQTIDSVLRQYIKSAKQRGLEWELSDSEAKGLLQLPCYYCGISPSTVWSRRRHGDPFKYNGIDRVDNNVGYVATNVKTACSACNRGKFQMTEDGFWDWIKRVYEYHFKLEDAAITA